MKPHMPNVPLVTQENRRVRFYDDVIKGRVVLINFMFATCNGACPRTSANLRKVQKALGAHAGRDVFLCSLTLDPEHDTPEVLRDYSKSLGAARGWTFLTGRPEELELLRRSLGFTDPDPKVDADKTKHSGIVVFGDDAAGRWSMMPALVDPNRIVSALKRLLSFRVGVPAGEFSNTKRRPPGAPLPVR
jgi:protein SCO1/2